MSWLVPSAAPIITDEDVAAVEGVLRSGWLSNGPETVGLEEDIAAWCGAAHVVAVANGTVALLLAGQALGLGRGDVVLVPAFTFAATATAFISLGCTVVPVDVDPDTKNLDPNALQRALRDEGPARAVVVVDLYGSTIGTDEAIEVAREAGLVVIEDAAQAHGAAYGDDRQLVGSGSRADITTFSLYASKNLMCGEGGLMATASEQLDGILRRLRNHGGIETYRHEILGLNHRMPEMSAALARSQLRVLAERMATRRANAACLTEWCAEAWQDLVRLPSRDGSHDPRQVFHQYVVVFQDGDSRTAVERSLMEAGIDCRVFYPYTIAELPGVEGRPVPVAEHLRDSVLALPVHPGLDAQQLKLLRGAIRTTSPLVVG